MFVYKGKQTKNRATRELGIDWVVSSTSQKGDLASGRERQLRTGGRAEESGPNFPFYC